VITRTCHSKEYCARSVQNGQHKQGTQLLVDVRGKKRDARIVKMPFQATNYFKGEAPVAAARV
jgi:glycine cleavage system aminomethyltransferase T